MNAICFDTVIDRHAFPTERWNSAALNQHFGTDEVIPFWIADMDFAAPPVVIDALMRRAEHGAFGYEHRPESMYEVLIDWYAQRHNWPIEREDVCNSPGVMNTIATLVNMHSEEGDGVIIQPPVFFEFRTVLRSNQRTVVRNALILEDGRYRMDLDDLEMQAANPANKILILCNPHNPTGRVWTREELTNVAEICRQHDVRVISDEIHGDIAFDSNKYVPFASLSRELSANSFTCVSPAKTFNLPGVVDAFVIIPNEEHRIAYRETARRLHLNRTNVFASAAIESAYRDGGEWLDALLSYLQGNIAFIRERLLTTMPVIKMIEPEGTYLLWLDFRSLGLDVHELERFLAFDAGLALNAGYWFGRQGANFARMTIASPRSVLEDAMDRLAKAVKNR